MAEIRGWRGEVREENIEIGDWRLEIGDFRYKERESERIWRLGIVRRTFQRQKKEVRDEKLEWRC